MTVHRNSDPVSVQNNRIFATIRKRTDPFDILQKKCHFGVLKTDVLCDTIKITCSV